MNKTIMSIIAIIVIISAIIRSDVVIAAYLYFLFLFISVTSYLENLTFSVLYIVISAKIAVTLM